jgi:GAF domain-containing protein
MKQEKPQTAGGGKSHRFDWSDWLLTGIGILAPVSIILFSQLATTEHINSMWLIASIGAGAVTAGLPTITAWRASGREKTAQEREKTIEQRVKDAIAATYLQVSASLVPIVGSLGEGIAHRRPGLVDQTLASVVGAVGDVIRPRQGLRACYLSAEQGPPRKLVLGEYQKGRVVANPQTEIVENTPLGKHVFEKFEKNESEFNPNVDEHPPTGLTKEEIAALGYKTFISVPVVAGGLGYGLLTVDGLHPGDLDPGDLDVMRVMADLVAIAMASEAVKPHRRT